MGLIPTVLHLYRKSQEDVLQELTNELRQNHGLSKFSRIPLTSDFDSILENEIYPAPGVCYLITDPHNNWTTIVEVNINIEQPFHLHELTNALSKRLDTYALSFHLHDHDVLYYNIDAHGESLDGYNSFLNYFLDEAPSKEEILSQRHNPRVFTPVLPRQKNVEELNEILNGGYWNAFDNGDLDEDGVPNGDKYFEIDEQDRFERIGKYLEIYDKDNYPFADWVGNFVKLGINNWYLLKAEK